MNVHPFNPCISDVHNAIDISLKSHSGTSYYSENDIQTTALVSERVTGQFKVRAWDNSQSKKYVENLNTNLLQKN